MKNTEMYYKLVDQFMRAFDQKHYRFTSDVPDNTLHLRGDLIDEELEEYTAALKANDELAQLDGLCDLAYVVAGTLLTCGLLPIPYSAPKLLHERSIEPMASDVVYECYRQIPCHRDMSARCNRLLSRIDDVGYRFNLPKAFVVVHDNNMKKMWQNKPSHELGYIAVPKGPGRWLVRNKSGKVVKPLDHVKPNLTPFINANP